jgi:propanol-preferring alcohol dehydrogenase
MRAAILTKANQRLSIVKDYPIPKPGPNQILVKNTACGVCRTDIHVYEGDLKAPKLPLILGHEIIGRVVELGSNKDVTGRFKVGERVGTGWLAAVDGTCSFCRHEQENLCENPLFRGYTVDGGFAEYTCVDADFAEPVPPQFSDIHAAPLMCAGLIGYRTYKKSDITHIPNQIVGIYGFGAAAHICAQIAPLFKHKVFAFTRPGDISAQKFALGLGCEYAGDSDKPSPLVLDTALIFASDGNLVVHALQNVRKGATVVCGGIHMTDIPSFPYASLWGERTIKSVANLTKKDAKEFLELASQLKSLETTVTCFPLEDAQLAIDSLMTGKLNGAAVLTM